MLGIYNSIAISNLTGFYKSAGSASIAVRKQSDDALASIFSGRLGSPSEVLSNPFNADSDGRFEFYADHIDEGYKITVTKGSETYTLNNQMVQTDPAKIYLFTQISGEVIDEEIFFTGFQFKQKVEITEVTLHAREAPVGANIQLDFLKGAAEQSKLSTLTAGSVNSEVTAITGLTYETTDVLGLIVKNIGSGTLGSEVTVIIEAKPTD